MYFRWLISAAVTLFLHNAFANDPKLQLSPDGQEAVQKIEQHSDYRLKDVSGSTNKPLLSFEDTVGRIRRTEDSQGFLKELRANPKRNVVVITDMNPDDRIALSVLAARIPERLHFIGTTTLHAWRKSFLGYTLLKELGLFGVPVYPGTGGNSWNYPDIISSKAIREYSNEGQGLLDPDLLAELNKTNSNLGSLQLQRQLEALLEHSKWSRFKVEIVLLTAPTDLIAVLVKKPHLREGIQRIHVAGGWLSDPANADLRTTYNWSMDPSASARLVGWINVPTILYSSHIVDPLFVDGTINSTNYPEIIDAIEKSDTPSLKSLRSAIKAWNNHLKLRSPTLYKSGKNTEKQFTPADALVAVGLVNPEMITAHQGVRIELHENNLDPEKGFKVVTRNLKTSKVHLVTEIDTEVFARELLTSLKRLGDQNTPGQCPVY